MSEKGFSPNRNHLQVIAFNIHTHYNKTYLLHRVRE